MIAEVFELSPGAGPRVSHRHHALFRVTRAQRCRQWIWARLKAAEPNTVTVQTLAQEAEGEFHKPEIYKATRMLVVHGLAHRQDLQWAEIVRGKERQRMRIALSFIEPFTESAGRCKW